MRGCLILWAASAGVLGLCHEVPLAAQTANQSASLVGTMVFPKMNATPKIGTRSYSIGQIALPWVVDQINGDWLWVGRGHRAWVHRSQVVTFEEAPAYYTGVIQRSPRNSYAYNFRAVAWAEKGELDRALPDLDLAIRLAPSAWLYHDRGEVRRRRKEYDLAIADFNEAIRRDPSYATAYCTRGVAWTDKQEWDRSLADFNRAIELDPQCALAYCNRGLTWVEKQDDSRAIADFGRCIQLDPYDAGAYIYRASARYRARDIEGTIADCDQAICIDVSLGAAYFYRGKAWAKQEKFDQAITDFDQAIRLLPNDPAPYYRRAHARAALRKFDLAIADYEHLLRLEPDSAEVIAHLVWILAACPDEAFRDSSRAVRLSIAACESTHWKEFGCVDMLALVYAQAGDFASAIKYELLAKELAAGHPEYRAAAEERLAAFRRNSTPPMK